MTQKVMTQDAAMNGEKVYEQELDLTGVTDFGVSMDDIITGKEAIPPQGARFDLAIDIFGNIRLSTASEEYAWVNERQIWSVGTTNLATKKIHIEAFRQ